MLVLLLPEFFSMNDEDDAFVINFWDKGAKYWQKFVAHPCL